MSSAEVGSKSVCVKEVAIAAPSAKREKKPADIAALRMIFSTGKDIIFYWDRHQTLGIEFSMPRPHTDAQIPDIPALVLHKIRRTTRSLLSRAMRSRISLTGLAHVLPSIEGVYDRHSYDREKGKCFGVAGFLILTIINRKGRLLQRFL